MEVITNTILQVMEKITDGFLQRRTEANFLAVGAIFTIDSDPSYTLWICTGWSLDEEGNRRITALPYLPRLMKFPSDMRVVEYTNPAFHEEGLQTQLDNDETLPENETPFEP